MCVVTCVDRDDLPKLPFLTSCIKEALRLHTPVPMISRQLTKDVDIQGCTIPAGTHVDVHLYILHHNVTVWDAPYVSLRVCVCVSNNISYCKEVI